MGLTLDLEADVGAVLFGEWDKIVEGDTVKRTGHLLEIVGDALLGRLVDPLRRPLDDKGDIDTTETRRPSSKLGVVERHVLQTGLMSIDGMIPIGRGQRELIIGDRQTGKTAIAIDTTTTTMQLRSAADVDRNDPAQGGPRGERGDGEHDHRRRCRRRGGAIMAPYAGCAMGEHFLYNGKAALCVYDDLTKHAYAYRQMSLLLRHPPGREAYPG